MNRAIEHLVNALKPKGTKNLVKLFLTDASYFEEDFVTNLIDELEKKSALVNCGIEEFSLSDQLALAVLADSSHWKDTKRQIDEAGNLS
ncbi:hypothetical protein NIES4074_36310 [Cylindrospermum sp. NIES-4074]|nr:hypothetical protein NIES4074_36310 [Cylindrospermum sp. NIES-4074]